MTSENMIQINGTDFTLNGRKLILRGLGAGSWMNIEHFMLGIPGTEHLIKQAFISVYGKQTAATLFDTFLTSFFTEADASFLEEIGINTLRIPVNHHYFLDDQQPEVYKESGFIYLDRTVNLCAKHGIRIIIDMHTAPGGQNPDWHCDTETGVPLFWEYGALRTSFIHMWQHIAGHYKDNPWIAGYDLLNEPALVPNQKLFSDFYIDLITAVRAIDSSHILFIEGSNFARNFDSLDLADDSQSAFSFHYYPSVWHPEVLSENFSSEERIKIYSDTLQNVLNVREHYNRPLWCGEMGIEFSQQDIQFQQELTELMIGLCEKNEVSWSFWAYKDAQCMGIVYPDSETPWMHLVTDIKKSWDQSSELPLGNKLIRNISKNYFCSLDEDTIYKLQFRLRTLFHTMAVESFLKPALQKQNVEELKNLSNSFLFENCKEWKEITDILRKFCKK